MLRLKIWPMSLRVQSQEADHVRMFHERLFCAARVKHWSCGVPSQCILAPRIAIQIVIDLARLGPIVGPHLDHVKARASPPGLAESFGLPIWKPREKFQPIENKWLLEMLREGCLSRHTISNTRTRTQRSCFVGKIPVVKFLLNSIDRQKASHMSHGKNPRSQGRRHQLITKCLQRDVGPFKDCALVLRTDGSRNV